MRIALAQLTPTSDPVSNAERLVVQASAAARSGARLVVAPEGAITDVFGDPGSVRRNAQPLDGPFTERLRIASQELQIAIAAGTFVPTDDGRVANVLVLLDRGVQRMAYRKIHLYDAFAHRESDGVVAGDDPAPVLDLDGVRIGVATCYDLRFPELFRSLSQRGADVMLLSSAWAEGPGKVDHWLTLLRARAIENTCYVAAADQMGAGCVGRSAVFDPFGDPLVDLGEHSPALGLVDIDLGRLAEIRARIPSGTHRRIAVGDDPAW